MKLSGALKFALRASRRDWRSGELNIIVAAMIIAVANVAVIGLLGDRVERAMNYQASELLAADLVVLQGVPPSPEWREQGTGLGLASTETVEFRSMLVAGERLQLAEVKAVAQGYPLRGVLESTSRQDADTPPQAGGLPGHGEVWLEPRLARLLEVDVGAQIQLGKRSLRVTRFVTREPDRAGGLFSMAPRVLVNLSDLDSTGLIQPGSTIQYRLLVAGEEPALAQFRTLVSAQLAPGGRLQGVRDARPEIKDVFERADRFLGVSALVSVLLSGVAMASAAARYTRRHWDSSALLRCMGASQAFVLACYLWQILLFGLVAALLGGLLGYLVQAGIALLVADLFASYLPPPSLLPLGHALLTGMVMLVGFAFPPLVALRRAPPLRVLQRFASSGGINTVVWYGAAFAAIVGLMLWQTGDVALTLYVLLGGTGTIVALVVPGYALVVLVRALQARGRLKWRLSLANVTRQPGSSLLQVASLALGMMAVLLLAVVHGDLLSLWKARLPERAPNHFMINIQAPQVEGVREFFRQHALDAPRLYPMVRGRLVAINDRAVDAGSYTDSRARRLVQREFNLSWASELREDNTIVSGRFWGQAPGDEPELSIEQGIAATLGIAQGDTLTYLIAGQRLSARVTSVRTVEWDSFNVNFFVLMPPAQLQGYPGSFITSFYLEDDARQVLNVLVKRFPNVTVIDVGAIMAKIRLLMDRLTRAVEVLLLFTLMAGVVVLYAVVHSGKDERVRSNAILRALGATNTVLRRGMLVEFAVVGMIAGTVAALGANLVGFVLAGQLFGLHYYFNIWLWLAGMTGGVVGVCLAGLLATRDVLRLPPLWVLRRS